MTIRVLALLFLLLPSFSLAGNTRFTEKEVRENALKFINTVFGRKPPTVADLIHFEGYEHGVLYEEMPLAYKFCKRKFKTDNPPTDERSLKMFDGFSYEHPEQIKSLYYRLLRKRVGVSANKLKIESVSRAINGFLITVIVPDSNGDSGPVDRQLLLRHVDSTIDVHESGIIWVQAVVVPTFEYLTEDNNWMAELGMGGKGVGTK